MKKAFLFVMGMMLLTVGFTGCLGMPDKPL